MTIPLAPTEDECRRALTRWLDLRLMLALRGLRATDASGRDINGLFLSGADVESLLASEKQGNAAGEEPLRRELQAQARQVEGLRAARRTAGAPVLLDMLGDAFQLNELERVLVWICAAHALDARYEKVYAYLNDDLTRPYPTARLAETVLELNDGDRAGLRASLRPGAPLFRLGIFADTEPGLPYHAMRLVLDPRLADFLGGENGAEACALGATYYGWFLRVAPTVPDLANLELPVERLSLLGRIADRLRADEARTVFLFHGPAGSGKFEAAAALSKRAGLPALRLDARRLLAQSPEPVAALRAALKESRLWNSALIVTDCDSVPQPGAELWMEQLAHEIQEHPLPVFCTASERSGFRALVNLRHIDLDFPLPDARTRTRVWNTMLGNQAVGDGTAALLGARFPFTEGQIRASAAAALDRAALTGAVDAVREADLLASCTGRHVDRLAGLATRVPAKFAWNDLVLADEPLAQLRELCEHVRHGDLVYEQWGYERTLVANRGLHALFSGLPGTGKTMAASIIAAQLERELYRIDLSTIVSKYIGETEKNLGRVFDAARDSSVVLFFDEADALFGKRGEVRDSHDRYANIETSYLLQKMEEHAGVSILATNLLENLDAAFARRLHFLIEFPLPGVAERRRIWELAFPPRAPLAGDVDFDRLAESIKLSGANIKNVALRAAFFAASAGDSIGMRHIVRSIERECQKEGRPYMAGELGSYSVSEFQEAVR